MKKSEFIRFLAKELFYRDQAALGQFWYREDDQPLLENEENKDSYYTDAKMLLSHIEWKGMEPPRIIKKLPGIAYPFSVSEWEPE